jgi:hypothetical protein
MNPGTSSYPKVLNFEIHPEFSCYSFLRQYFFQLMKNPEASLGVPCQSNN